MTVMAQATVQPLPKPVCQLPARAKSLPMLHEGQWIPLGKSTGSASANIPHAMRELADFLDLQPTRSAVVFPLTAGSAAGAMSKPLCGLVLMERDAQTEGFSENLLDLGAIVSQLLEPRLLQLAPASAAAPPQKINSARRVDEDSLSDLSRRLNYERWLRLTICKLHSSLDRDHVLQTLADSLGRAFRTTRCLIIRTDGPSHPMVTHEYVEPDLSPLGLGRTGQFPMFAISLFTQKTISYGDVSQIRNTGPLIPPEVEQLLENGILSMAGAPLSYQGQPFGVLILVDGSRARQWTEEEMETIELTASQASVALSHSQTYHQVKDQLFHMNLLGNLTQQLTNALEVATKSPTKNAAPSLQDKNGGDGIVTPLSSREMEVLRLIASGLANREIAQRLFLTESTVELHASRIRKKLHLKSRTALVKYACDNSLV